MGPAIPEIFLTAACDQLSSIADQLCLSVAFGEFAHCSWELCLSGTVGEADRLRVSAETLIGQHNLIPDLYD